MRKFFGVLVMSVILAVTAGCSREVVPPATKGKILSTAGYSADVKEPGGYWLSWWENMVLLDTSTQTMTENLEVLMADRLKLGFSVKFRTRISGNDKVINAMFNDIRHQEYMVSLPMVYNVYGRDVVQNAAREVVGKYKTEEVAANFNRISAELHTLISERMKNSPLEVSNVTLGNLVYPRIITAAIEAAEERRLAIATEENQQAIALKKKQNELELAQQDYEIRMTKARAIRDENKTTAEGLNPMLLEYRRLEMIEQLSEKGNNMVIPVEGLVNPIMQSKLLGK